MKHIEIKTKQKTNWMKEKKSDVFRHTDAVLKNFYLCVNKNILLHILLQYGRMVRTFAF